MWNKLSLFIAFCLLFTSSAFSQSKTWDDCFTEASRRLVNNPMDANFKIDPALVGDWKGIETVLQKYGIKIRYIKFNSNATGRLEVVPLYLTENKTFNFATQEGVYLDFYWGVWVGYNNKQPVTMIKLIFHDKSHVWLYYIKPRNDSLTVAYYDEATRKAAEPVHHTTARSFDRQWNEGADQTILATLWDYYIKKQQLDQARLNNHLRSQFSFMGAMGAAGSWMGGIQPPRY